MTETELDLVISGLVELRQKSEQTETLDKAIKALKEFRQKKTHWKNLVKGVKVIQRVQKRGLQDTDDLIEALLQ